MSRCRLAQLAVVLGALGASSLTFAACVGDDPAFQAADGDSGAQDGATSADSTGPDTSATDAGLDAKGDAGPSGPRFLAIDAANHLVKFSRAALASTEIITITGLNAGETIVGVDVRPRDGVLYGLGSANRLYRIDKATGAAAQIGPVFLQPLAGSSFGMDFVPSVDRIRIVTSTGENFRINPDDGAFIGPDTNLAYSAADPGTGKIPSGDALGNLPVGADAAAGAATTFLVDGARKALCAFVGNPNQGSLVTIGDLNVASGAVTQAGFDIVRESGADNAYLVMNPGGAPTSTLYRVDLTTGAATALGQVGGAPLRALTHEL
jgi:hypothetical protein